MRRPRPGATWPPGGTSGWGWAPPDVSVTDGQVEVIEIDELPRRRGDRLARRTGFDPRTLTARYRWFRVTPRRIRAWREADELVGRELMGDGRWLV